MKQINFLPYWEPIEQYASSRLRCKVHHDNLNKFFYNQYKSVIGLNDKSDIIVITQRVKDENQLKQLEKLRLKGKTIVYDLVDKYYTEWFSKRLFNLSNYIIVANQIQKIYLSYYTTKPIYVLEDSIDYYEQMNKKVVLWNNNILWFGNFTNIDPLYEYFKELSSMYKINVITQSNRIKKLPNINYIEWSYNNFIEQLRKNSLVILGHGFNDLQKSHNKILVSICNGVPVLATQSISYRNVLNNNDLGKYYFHNYHELLLRIEELKDIGNRKKYFKLSQNNILENYNSLKITEDFIDIIEHKVNVIKRNKNVVYTANFGNYDKLYDLCIKNDKVDYFYFTDNRDIKSKHWNVIYVEKPFYEYSHKNSKYYKILPHDFLYEYDKSIWIDSCIYNIRTKFDYHFNHLNRYDLLIHKHPDRSCLYVEGETCIKLKKDKVEIIERQLKDYKLYNYPSNNGLFWCGFLARKHNRIININELWWDEINKYSKRDQISFPFVLYKYNLRPNMLVLSPYDYKNYFNWEGTHNKK